MKLPTRVATINGPLSTVSAKRRCASLIATRAAAFQIPKDDTIAAATLTRGRIHAGPSEQRAIHAQN